jgi:hypothetical protein
MGADATPRGTPSSSVLGRLRSALAEFTFGMTGYEFARHAIETRAALENVFMLVVVGDMIGVPVIPPYYSLRLLPFVTPEIVTWKRRVLREREFTDEHDFHLHGV